MATVNQKMKFRSLAAIAFCFLAIVIALNSNAVMPFVWRLWYGSHMTWNGIEVEINGDEQFMPLLRDESDLFIADWKSKNGNIVVHKGNRTIEHQKAFVLDFCRPGECSQEREKGFDVNGRRVTSFTFVKPSQDGIYHEYIVIDGADTWVEFFGTQSGHQDHKPTLDNLVKKIANKSPLIKPSSG